MLAELKLFKKKKNCETTLEATGTLKNFTKITVKQLRESLFDKAAGRAVIAHFLEETASATCLNFQWYLVH